MGIGFFVVKGVSPIFAKANPVPLAQAAGSDKGTYIDGTAYISSEEFYRITHLVVVIPAGFDHYFLCADEDFSYCVVVRADKNWAKQFDEYGFSNEGVRVNGVLKEMDFDLSKEVNSMRAELETPIAGYYVDTLSDRYAVFTIIVIAVLLILGALMLIQIKKGTLGTNALTKVILGTIAITCLFDIHVMIMM